MQCLRFFHDYFQWKKILVRATHLVLVFFVISTLIFQSSELNYAIHSSNYIYCFLYGFLVYISLFFYFLTCYIDPGYVPYNKFHNTLVTSDSEDDEVYIENAVQSSTTSTNSVPMRKCLHCNIQQPLRSHHCDYCNRCVRKYDHHCPYLETCIGERNHRFFWFFLLTTDILVIWSLLICGRSFIYFNEWQMWLHKNAFRLFSMHILIVSLFAVTILFLIHSVFMCTNTTTWEKVARHRITYLKHITEEYNPFHEGYCSNMCTFFCECREKHWDVVYKKSLEHVVIQM